MSRIQKRLWTCAITAAAMAGVLAARAGAQNGADPFIDHGDRGEVIHVLPGPAAVHNPRDNQPIDAPVVPGTSVYAPSYGSGNLTDHRGPEIAGAQFKAIYWNNSVASSTATSMGYQNISAQIDGFISAFSDHNNWDNSPTDDFTIVQQY